MKRHRLDPYPIPKDKAHLYINEPWLIDESLRDLQISDVEPENEGDNIRIYIPMDLNKKAILRRLETTISRYGEATEMNEIDYSSSVDSLIDQVEIYDQVWYVRHIPKEKKHSLEAIELVREMVSLLEKIPDGCAECFPSETIERLRGEYLG